MIAWQMMFRKEKRDGKDEGQFEAWLSPGCSKLLLPDQRSTKCEAQAGSGNDSRTCGPDTVLRPGLFRLPRPLLHSHSSFPPPLLRFTCSQCTPLHKMPTQADVFLTPSYDQQQPDSPQQQIKVCSSCQRPLSTDSANTPFILQDGQASSDTSIVCGPCLSRYVASRTEPPVPTPNGLLFAEVERELLRRVGSLQDGSNEANELSQLSPSRSTHPTNDPCPDAEMVTESSRSQPPSLQVQPDSPSTRCRNTPSADLAPRDSNNTTQTQVPLSVVTHDLYPPSPRAHISPQRDAAIISSSTPRSKTPLRHYTANPLTDITRLRVRSQGHHCLYPGAIFQGTQKSGRNSYDVTVTIVVSYSILIPNICADLKTYFY